MTPIAEIAELKIGSRPASRTKSDRIEDLRAIPWVFSWAQARVMLPGWYGVGHGAARRSSDKGLLREMVEGWPFFRATLDNLEMVLAKSDMAIAARYADLVEDAGAARRDLRPHPRRLAADPRRAARRHRPDRGCSRSNPGARRRRSGCACPISSRSTCSRSSCSSATAPARTTRASREGIQLSINAIATALQNSG